MKTEGISIPQYVLDEAKRMLEAKDPLPARISGSIEYYLARESDETVMAFCSFEDGYKIGVTRQIPQYVLEIARKLIKDGNPLPSLISERAEYYLADKNDETVVAYYLLEGEKHKIGVKKT